MKPDIHRRTILNIIAVASRTGRWLRANNKAPFFVALLIFVATLAAYLYYWSNLRSNVQKDMSTAYNRQVRLFNANLSTRMQLYETLLRGGAGVFTLNGQLSQEGWSQYFQPYEISKNYPDIAGIGLAEYVTPGQLDTFLEERRAQDPTYAVRPEGTRDSYAPILYVAKYSKLKGSSIGFDGLSDPTRRAAMLRAADSGKPALSGQIRLVADTAERPAFVAYLPVYQPDMSLSSAAERRTALYGFSYMSIDAKTMFAALQSDSNVPYFAVKVTDPQFAKANPKGQPAYETANFTEIIKQDGTMVTTSKMSLFGYTYDVTFAGSSKLISSAERQLPMQALLRGVFSSLLFAAVVWYLITFRERKLNHWKQKEVQTAKDDLLSLASHQLRTPATVVKQYVGMLLQGYGGKLTEQQMNMLSNAYESNERQLEIINQLLYVARLDAGRISLRKETVNVSQLVRAVLTDQKGAAADRKQSVRTHLPKNVVVTADPRYLRMVFENLLSNAIKYTPEGGSITLSVSQDDDWISLAVADTGVGLEPRHTDTIFDKFTRVENILSTDVNGNGVGLYLTKEIITLHGGLIDVSSTLGKGSTFTVKLPKDTDV